jgi:hypothetical protein
LYHLQALSFTSVFFEEDEQEIKKNDENAMIADMIYLDMKTYFIVRSFFIK